jgi:hypothetical protein
LRFFTRPNCAAALDSHGPDDFGFDKYPLDVTAGHPFFRRIALGDETISFFVGQRFHSDSSQSCDDFSDLSIRARDGKTHCYVYLRPEASREPEILVS